MAIDGISGGGAAAVTYGQLSGTGSTASNKQDSGIAPAQGGGSGKFADAIAQALAQVDGGSASTSATSGTTASGDATGTQDPQQAEAAFAQSLFSALQSQAGGSPAQAQAQSHSGGGGHHHHGGGGGGISGGLQSLAQQLSSTSGTDTNTSITDSSTDTATSDGSASPLTALKTSFNNLLAANGQSADSASLPQFLQTLSQGLHGASNSGNVVSTKA